MVRHFLILGETPGIHIRLSDEFNFVKNSLINQSVSVLGEIFEMFPILI